jgi:hypothetical protein
MPPKGCLTRERATRGIRVSISVTLAPIVGLLIVDSSRAQAAQYWYYCDPTHTYYPYVNTCSVPWREVLATASPPAQSEPARLTPSSTATIVAPQNEAQPSTAFQQGQADRQAWESWFDNLAADKRGGADYWAAHRSVPNPRPCGAVPPSTGADWTAGCLASQQKLAASDVRRKSESDYRLGWNSPVAVAPSQLPAAEPLVYPPVHDQPPEVATQARARVTPPDPSNVGGASYKNEATHVLAQWTGNSMMTTRPFHVEGPFEIQWTAASGYFSIHLARVGGREELIANQVAPSDSSSYVPNPGDYYLKITSSAPWGIKIVPVEPTEPVGAATNALRTGALSGPDDGPITTARPPELVPIKASSEKPDDESAVLEIVEAAMSRYKTGQNDMQRGAARPIRGQSICSVLPSRRARNWIGTVTKLSTNGDGKGVLHVQVAPDIYVQTWNNALSDTFDKTLIDPQTALFRTVSQLREGQKVRFSGSFASSEIDCIEEASMTMQGSITQPEFIFKFDTVSAIE